MASFSFSSQDFFDLILDVTGASSAEFLDRITFIFIDDDDLNNLVARINSFYSLTGLDAIPNPTSTVRSAAIGEIVNSIMGNTVLSGANKSVASVGFEACVLQTDSLSDTYYRIEQLCSEWMGADPVGQIKKLILPSIVLNAKISAGIAFPRELLLPVKPNGEVETNTAVKSRILFDAGNFKFSTYGGIGFDESLVATFDPAYPLAQIGKSPIRIGFNNARLDLSRTKNIAAADADGRPSDFMGVYIDEATISFPKFWQQDPNGPPSTAQIVGRKLLIGTGGFSGTIALEGSNQGDLFHTRLNNPNGFAIGLHAFELRFRQNAIVGSTIKGWLTIPGIVTFPHLLPNFITGVLSIASKRLRLANMKEMLTTKPKNPSQDEGKIARSYPPVPYQLKTSESQKEAASSQTEDLGATSPIVGKAAFVPKKPDGSTGAPVPLYQLEGDEMKPTAAFEALAQEDEAVARLLGALQLAIKVQFARQGIKSQKMSGLKYWLTSVDAIPTRIVLSSSLEPQSPEERQEKGEGAKVVPAATMYNAKTKGTANNEIDWTNRGTLDASTYTKTGSPLPKPQNTIKPEVQAAFETEFEEIPIAATNLMVYDREEIMNVTEKELASIVFHEFFVHLSMPKSLTNDPYRQVSSLDWYNQHAMEEDYQWDAQFSEELKHL